ncbi:MAG: bifunctional alpha,alpha-trehalose-phosphate synthase (UDP-forming)/trehalose-phosphatase [Candidatus Bipolaricaulota bacterium]
MEGIVLGKLIIVSNRLPMVVSREGEGFDFRPSVGGLATGLGSFYKDYESVWVGWPGLSREELDEGDEQTLRQGLEQEGCLPVVLARNDFDLFYRGFCNNTLWPLFHYFLLYTEYRDDYWEAYKRVNQAFADAVLEVAEPDDTIWIQDYHLLLLPGLIRQRLPEATIGFFLHIPFPSSEVFRLLPWREEILENLLGADLIGFHTYDYLRHFFATVRRLLGHDQAIPGKLVLLVGDRLVRVDAFPMGIDFQHYTELSQSPDVEKEMERMQEFIGPRKVILSLDRLDYSKGLIQRLEAFDLFLERYPEYRENVTLVLKAIASRTGVRQYAALKRRLDELVGRINGKYSSISWMPIWYLYQFLPEESLVALYRLAEVALLTPLRDGMNLIAKEFLASRFDESGVLVLSEMAGAAKELPEALLVNPNNTSAIADNIKEGLEMPLEERRARNRVMRNRLERYHVVRWAQDFMDGVEAVKTLQAELSGKRLTAKLQEDMVERFTRARRRLILLDYEGTLTPFASTPKEATPDPRLLDLLQTLATPQENEVVVVSGRDRTTLDRWFGGLAVGLVAEHGVWLRPVGEDWQTVEPLDDSWKHELRHVLEFYVDRTPGSFLEEKDYSLVWHYRKTDLEFGAIRLGELKEDLSHLTANFDLGILEGNRVVEVRHAGINKGRGAAHWLGQGEWDFIFAAGDDRTDEDIFATLPDWACSVRVGLNPSQARFHLRDSQEVRGFLERLAAASQGERR